MDLTTLQTEAYRFFHISPKEALSIAEELYLKSYTSYPRTSSQKLPPTIGYKKILEALSKQSSYKPLCTQLLNQEKLKPNEGKKTDLAHPAIYPTGVVPSALNDKQRKIYDLIVKRFLATFAPPAKRLSITVSIDVENEDFITKGITTVEKGWHTFYEPYIRLKEEEIPLFEKGDKIHAKKYYLDEKETQPPKRYTPASIIKTLERKNLGTKATRANIVDTLYKRGYVDGVPIKISSFGKTTIEVLKNNLPKIIDDKLTRKLENDMELIRKNEVTEDYVINESIKYLDKILSGFKKKEKIIGEELKKALYKTTNDQNTLGDCPVCHKGKLVIKKGKYGRFVGCTNYPECKVTIKLPAATIRKTNEVCPYCGFPMVMVYKKGKKPQKICVNPACPSKKEGFNKEEFLKNKKDNNNNQDNTTNSNTNKNNISNNVDNNKNNSNDAHDKMSNQSNNESNSKYEKKDDNSNKKNNQNDKNNPKNKDNESDLICPLCGGKLVKRKSIYGEFYGCSNYPKCKYTRKI